MAGTPDHASTKTNIDLDVIVQLTASSSPAASSKGSSTDSFSNPNFATLRVLPLHCSSARRPVSSATRTRHSACLLTRRDVRVPLLSHARTAISCFGGSGATQRLLQRTSTGTRESSSKRHPVHCAKCHTTRIPQVPATGRQHKQRDKTCRTLNDNNFNLPHHHKETRTDKRSGMNS